MGKVLQIRVIAVTWNDELLEDYWPRLTRLAFSLPVKFQNHGLLEMVRALSEGLKFMKWSDNRREIMGPDIEKAEHLRHEIDEALADWQPGRANELSNSLEATLDKLEREFVE